MNTTFSKEKIKPFKLVKYFTFSSLIVIFLGALILSALNTHWARTMLIKKSEDYALVLIENLNHQLFQQFIIPVYYKYRKIQLRDKEQFEWMDKVVRSTLHSFKVDMVNIYDSKQNVISYSYDKNLIGKKNLGGTGYQHAVSGKSTSNLVQNGNIGGILLGLPEDSRIITFAPLRAEKPLSKISGPILGVVEIVQDLSEDYQTIFKFQVHVILTCTVVMGVLFLVLLFVVKRGESIFQQRAAERLRLEEQLRRAEHLSSLGEMVAGVSHEIRNPLGIIRNSAELLKKKMSGTDSSNSIPDVIVEEASRLNNIITDFLNYAKPRDPDLMPCQVFEVIEKNITFLATQMEEQGYLIEKNCGNNLPEIMADPDMLYQAFLNIFINAMQAMPHGGKIDIEIRSSGNNIIILFEDEGGGVPKDLLAKIWDPFFTTKEKGTGLGLGIVKKIIESHEGGVWIENKSAGGARVTVELPIK